jgi:hypothetical protein
VIWPIEGAWARIVHNGREIGYVRFDALIVHEPN